MNPVFQTQTTNPMFTNGFNQFPFPSPFPQNFVNQGCPVTGFANAMQPTIDPIFNNVSPTMRQGWNTTPWNTTPWNTTPWNSVGFAGTPWTNSSNTTPWNTFNPTGFTGNWNGFTGTPWQTNAWANNAIQNTWPSTTFANMTNPYQAFPMAGICPITGVLRTNAYANFQNGFQTGFPNAWQNAINGFGTMPQWNGFTPMTTSMTTPVNYVPTVPFNAFNANTFGAFPTNTTAMNFMPGFWPTNYFPSNFIPTIMPTNYFPGFAANFTPTNYFPGFVPNFTPTNFVPTNTNGIPAVNGTQGNIAPQAGYTQPQNGYPTSGQPVGYQQAGYQQPGYGYPSYSGVSPVTMPTSMDPTEKNNKRTVMSRE